MVSSDALTNVAVCGTLLYVTLELDRKPEPLIVNVGVAVPAVTDAGIRALMTGTGLPTVKLTLAEAPPPGGGLVTITA